MAVYEAKLQPCKKNRKGHMENEQQYLGEMAV